MKASVATALKNGFILLATLLILAIWFGAPRGALIEKDAEENLAMAYNLRHHGIFSLDTDRASEALRPSRYREPLPLLVLSGYMFALDPILRDQPFDALLRGGKARVLQYSNVLWGMLLVGVMILTARRLKLPAWLTALAILLGHIPLVEDYGTLYTEVPAAALIALVSYLAWLALREHRLVYFFAAGLSFGALILTKASFLYVAIALIAFYIFYELLSKKERRSRRFFLRSTLLLIAGTALVITPWSVRNQIRFGSPNIADRGGVVLMTRAVKNGMTDAEYKGSFYAYGPRILHWPIAFLTGYRLKDLKAGGRLERLRRRANESDELAAEEGRVEDTISYYFHAKAMRTPLLAAFNAAGNPNPQAAADAELQKEAIQMIKAAPEKHLRMILPFMWRGAPFMFPFLVLVLIYAWRRRDEALAAYVLPSLGLICFYALLSHFIPRYAEPNAPIVALCAVLLLQHWLLRRHGNYKTKAQTRGIVTPRCP